MPLLYVEHMTRFFGGLRAVHDYNFKIEPGEIHGLIGPNGAGKSTIFNLITGVYKPTEGSIHFRGKNIIKYPSHKIAALGLGRTFQNLRLWRHMSVLDHIKMAQFSQITYGLIGAFFDTKKRNQQEEENTEKAIKIMELVGIGKLTDQLVPNLPYGLQRRVEIARALAINPKLLLLDEPTAGMNSEELQDLVNVIRHIHDKLGVAILLIEHRMKFVMDLCERIQTLDFGEVIAEGSPEEIQNNPRVIDAYLGKEVKI
ncbi:MAG: ABC transporter ATP-binding protein [Spirochaetes bacterium]|nr:ABC transporter ATP-binding protein [Spirochaetota bacterium]